MTIRHSLAGLAALATVFAAGTATAQTSEEYRNQIQAQIMHAGAMMVSEGFAYKASHIDTIRPSQSDTTTFDVTVGTTYQIFSVCDTDCNDVDIFVYNSSGQKIAQDILDDDIPIVTITPTANDRLRIETKMYNCDASYCYYGVGVFGR